MRIRFFFQKTFEVGLILFLLIQNMKIYNQMNESAQKLDQMIKIHENFLNEASKLENHIKLMKNHDLDLLETKAMWILGYSPRNSKILLD